MKKLLMIAVLVFTSSGLYAEEKMRIAIMDLQPKDTTKVIAGAVTDMLRSDFSNTKLFTIVERGQMAEILKEQALQLTGCTDQNCAVEVGKLLSANKILVGEVTNIAGELIITARIVDVKNGSVDFAAKEKAKNDSELDSATSRVAKKLTALIRGEEIKFCVSLRGAYVMPLGTFGKQVDPGYGGLADLYLDNLLFIKLKTGFETGYYMFKGASEKIDNAAIVPLQLFVSYGITFGRLSIEPRLLGGFTYNTVKNTKDYAMGKETTAFEPSAQAGILLSLKVYKIFSIQAGADYGMIFEKDGQLGFTVFYAGLDAKF
jgi:TolB-like protein